jgi:hypothetical protein
LPSTPNAEVDALPDAKAVFDDIRAKSYFVDNFWRGIAMDRKRLA